VSKVNKFIECQRSWAAQYVHNNWPGETYPLQVGKIVHGILERVASGKSVSDALQGALADDVDEATCEAAEEGRELAEQYLSTDYAVFDNTVDVERQFEIELGSKHQLSGVIDRVDDLGNGVYEIVDYKTSYMPIGQDEMDHSLQMHAYHYAASHLYPEAERFVMSIDMIRHDERVTTIPRDEDAQSACIYLCAMGDKMEAAMESGKFDARVFKYCCYCHVRGECAAYADALSDPLSVVFHEGTDLQSVVDNIEEIEAVEKILKQRKEELGVLVMQALEMSGGDKLSTGSHIIDLSVSRRGEYPAELAIPLLQQHDIDVAGVVTVQKTKVDKIAGKNQDLKAALNRIKRVRLGTPKPRITKLGIPE
jgi:RecB family exonuclease